MAVHERAAFVKEFSQKDFDYLMQGWQVGPCSRNLLTAVLQQQEWSRPVNLIAMGLSSSDCAWLGYCCWPAKR